MSEGLNLTLPTAPVAVKNKDPRSLLIYGSPKIGKTNITAGLEGNFILDIEGGTEFVEALKIDGGINNPKELDEVLKLLKDKPYPFVTIDTITKLEEWCEILCTVEYKNTPQGKNFKGASVLELDYGAGYGLLRNKFRKYINKIKKSADHTIFIGHVKDKIITKDQTEVAVKDINLTGQIKAIATSDVDAVGYVYLDPEDHTKRRITFLTSDEITCGNRCPHLEGQDFVISEKLEDGTIKTHWDKIFTQLK